MRQPAADRCDPDATSNSFAFPRTSRCAQSCTPLTLEAFHLELAHSTEGLRVHSASTYTASRTSCMRRSWIATRLGRGSAAPPHLTSTCGQDTVLLSETVTIAEIVNRWSEIGRPFSPHLLICLIVGLTGGTRIALTGDGNRCLRRSTLAL
jgi:hypothetical protein